MQTGLEAYGAPNATQENFYLSGVHLKVSGALEVFSCPFVGYVGGHTQLQSKSKTFTDPESVSQNHN